jgi:dihydroflavonol-4-reductase
VSLIYVRDLVDAVFLALQSERAANQTYFICGRAISYGEIASAIARVLGRRTMRIAVPEAVLGLIAFWARIQGRLTGKPALLNDQRIRDLRQPYWLCSGEKAQRELGFVAESDLDAAIRETADWYLENGWL